MMYVYRMRVQSIKLVFLFKYFIIFFRFRGPPRLWISAKPAVGDHTFDWSLVTNIIENKLCEEVYKYLVYPNMVDIILPFLGQPTYQTKDS